MPSSSSQFSSSTTPLPVCDAWGYIKAGNASNATTLVDGAGISTVSRLSTGLHGITFNSPRLFGGGGYVALYTPEVKNFSLPCLLSSQRDMGGSTAAGKTAGIQISTWKFANASALGGNTAEQLDFTFGDLYINTAVFALKTSNDMYNPYVANLLKYSEDFTQADWLSIVSGNGILPVIVPNVESNPVTGEKNAAKVTLSLGATSASANDYTLLYQSIPYSSSFVGVSGPNRYYTWSFWAKKAGAGSKFVVRGAAANAYTEIELTNEWKRYSGSELLPDAASTSMLGIAFTHRGGYGSSSTEAKIEAHIWGVQAEPGSLASPYTPTTNTAPVYGNQNAKINRCPGPSGGYGVTGATFNSNITNLYSKRTPTAYGSIVINPDKSYTSSAVSAYVEGGLNVSGVSAGAGSVFDVYFTKPLKDSNYCVVLSNEIEASVYATDWTDINEYSMLVIDRSYKTENGFRVVSLRQSSANNDWTRQSINYQLGLREKIHFMVFGGGTYGQP